MAKENVNEEVSQERTQEGRRWERFFLQPAAALVALFFLVLIGRAGFQRWRDRRLWGTTFHRRDSLWRWIFPPPKPQVIQSPEKLLREPERAAPLTLSAPPVRVKTAAAPETPAAKTAPAAVHSAPPPVRPAVPKRTEPAFVWDETDLGIGR